MSAALSRVITPGTGTRHPNAVNRVSVHYSGWTVDGKLFDSSVLGEVADAVGGDEGARGWLAERRASDPAELDERPTPARVRPQGLGRHRIGRHVCQDSGACDVARRHPERAERGDLVLGTDADVHVARAERLLERAQPFT